MVIWLDIDVVATLIFGNLFNICEASFNICATSFGCRRCWKNFNVNTLQLTKKFYACGPLLYILRFTLLGCLIREKLLLGKCHLFKRNKEKCDLLDNSDNFTHASKEKLSVYKVGHNWVTASVKNTVSHNKRRTGVPLIGLQRRLACLVYRFGLNAPLHILYRITDINLLCLFLYKPNLIDTQI